MGARGVRGGRGVRGARVVRLPGRPRSVRRVPLHPRRDQVPGDPLDARRDAARVPRVLPARHAVLLQPVAVRGDRGAAGRDPRRGRARRVDAERHRRRARVHVAGDDAPQRGDAAAGTARRTAAVRAVPAPRGAPVGTARRPGSHDRPVGLDGAGPDRRAHAVRCRCVPRRLRRTDAAARGQILARSRVLQLRRANLARRRFRNAGETRARRTRRHHVFGDARAKLPAVAVRPRHARRAAPARAGLDARQRQPADPDAQPADPAAHARHADAALHADVPCCAASYPANPLLEARFNLGIGVGNPRTLAFARRCASSIPATPTTSARSSTGSTRNSSSTRFRRSTSSAIRSTCSCSTRGAVTASTTRARSCCCCAPPAFRRASSPATRAAA